MGERMRTFRQRLADWSLGVIFGRDAASALKAASPPNSCRVRRGLGGMCLMRVVGGVGLRDLDPGRAIIGSKALTDRATNV
jgi:hypothetical protein